MAAQLRHGADRAGKNVDQIADYAYFSNDSWMIGAAEGEPEGSPTYFVAIDERIIEKSHRELKEIIRFASNAVEIAL
ncbi:hypothetical protein QP923_03810 [Corynebacterium sp. MSK151]|uniref:hypothetical protein n=1 Tax=Corynebacterium TaxID=1716 RepID=UPI00114D1C17|nr:MULTISPECIES: hypothetical protein [Corynebacterium]MDK8758720.1 hypothetical protein [Corynebacterium sp. MSK151]MDK8847756.1 hypothetical protein [Corynebacterium sp. MSK047]